jgi:hypothetical protein
MAIDLDQVLGTSDAIQIELLTFCVYARRLEPVFTFLVTDFRNRPASDRAHALHQCFCRTGAPGRLDSRALPPDDLRLEQLMRRLPPPSVPIGPAPLPTIPDRAMFDFVVDDLRRQGGPLAQVAADFDPERSAAENLPGGALGPGQRSFVERVWRPVIRAQLVRAGFWRIATIGG